MLAHHYSKAEQQEKTEEYLIKAGEESMKSGASSEAVNFLKKALEAHLKNTGNKPDMKKVFMLQEKLAFALYATGQFVEAVDNFDKVISFYYRPFPKSDARKIFDLGYNVLLILKIIYFYKSKHEGEPGEIEKKLVNIMDQKAKALITFDPKRMFFETLYGFRFFSKHKFGNYEAAIIMSHSMAFFYTGILFKLGQRLMEFAAKFLDEQYKLGWLFSKITQCVYIYYGGRKMEDMDEEKVYTLGIQIGEYWPITTFYFHGGLNIIESGNEKLFLHYLQRLMGVSEVFDNSYSLVQYQRLNVFYNLKFRKIEEALKVSEGAINIAKKTDHTLVLFMNYCFRSMAFSIRQDYDEARNNLSEAEKLLKGTRVSVYVITYLLARSYNEIAELKKETTNRSVRKIVLKTTKNLINKSQNIPKNLPEAYRLRAIVFWLLNKPDKALRNFEKSIKVAQSFDGNLELSRTYFETGKFLRDPKNNKERINGMNGTEYLMKAKSMFEEMSLQWDLKEYEKYMEGLDI